MDDEKKIASSSTENAADASVSQSNSPAKVPNTVSPVAQPEIKRPGDLTADSGADSGSRKLTRPTGKKSTRR